MEKPDLPIQWTALGCSCCGPCMACRKSAALIMLFMMYPCAAYADMVWPALYLEMRLLSVWPIAFGLVVEYLFIRYYFGFSVKQALSADVVANLASGVFGIVLIPLCGVLWEMFPGILLYRVLEIGTFNPGTWTATFLFAVAINALIESLAIGRIFKVEVGKKGFLVLCAANSLSVSVALISLSVYPLEM